MALTIEIEGLGVIANCDSITDDTGGTGTGDWSEQGTGTMTLSEDVFLFGSSSIAGKYASKAGLQQFDLGAGNELDFDVGGAEEGQFIYIWVNMAAFGTLDTLANTGLAIRISSSSPGTTNYKDYTIGGSNGANGWTGGWKLFVIDPKKAGSRINGACDIGAIRTMGVWIDTAASVRAESLWIDQIAVGSGIRLTGTSSTAIKDAADYCTAYASRAWGMLQEREDIYYAYGQLILGQPSDSTSAVDTIISDSGRVVKFGTSEYWTSGDGWITTFPRTANGIVVEDTDFSLTSWTDGILVGSDNGRSGTTFIGNDIMDAFADLYGGNNAASLTKLYGTALRQFTGGVTWGDDPDHVFYGGTITQSAQFDPVGGPILRNLTFAETLDTTAYDAALLWNENIDIQSCSFIANEQAIQHDTTSEVTYTNLTFSGNDYDVLYLDVGVLTITVDGGTIPTWIGPNGGTVSLPSSITLTMTVKDAAGDPINLAYAYIDNDDVSPFIMNKQTNAQGIASETWTGGAVADSIWRVRIYGYKPYLQTVDIGGVNISIPVNKSPAS